MHPQGLGVEDYCFLCPLELAVDRGFYNRYRYGHASKLKIPSPSMWSPVWNHPILWPIKHIFWAHSFFWIHIFWYWQCVKTLVPLVNIKVAGKWMFIPLKMVLIGIDSSPDMKSIEIQHMGYSFPIPIFWYVWHFCWGIPITVGLAAEKTVPTRQVSESRAAPRTCRR